ncbi:MAG: FG-GAP and VCBS repeat-containing protein [Gemmataceae bacterium]
MNAKNGQTLTTFRPLDVPGGSRYTGIVEVAIGDLNGDGIADVFVAAANPLKTDGLALTKASRVFVYDGATLLQGTAPAPFRTFTPFKNHFGPDPMARSIRPAIT